MKLFVISIYFNNSNIESTQSINCLKDHQNNNPVLFKEESEF